jgi:hypothetical protein
MLLAPQLQRQHRCTGLQHRSSSSSSSSKKQVLNAQWLLLLCQKLRQLAATSTRQQGQCMA